MPRVFNSRGISGMTTSASLRPSSTTVTFVDAGTTFSPLFSSGTVSAASARKNLRRSVIIISLLLFFRPSRLIRTPMTDDVRVNADDADPKHRITPQRHGRPHQAEPNYSQPEVKV